MSFNYQAPEPTPEQQRAAEMKAAGLMRDPFNGRVVPIPEQLRPSLEEVAHVHGKGKGFVLPSIKKRGDPMTRKNLGRGLQSMLEAIGISITAQKERNLVFHGLRHTFVSLSRTLGLSDFAAQRLAGHKSLEMTQRYSHGDMLDMKEIGKTISDALNA